MKAPQASFGEIAAWLHRYVEETRRASNVAELWGANVGSPSLKTTADLLDRDAVMAGQLFALFRDLAAHEQLVRDFLAGLAVLPAEVDDRRSAA